ncbi:hypothetical protein MNAN1_002948 [Malassezia nana]|uniref:VWFA domain-containing protein n=1 Tax=Malassezia nana TaxID=180528 RepID=A0AAF0J8E3_9BASI|nr:hypothetical protein MNAN1_002948 [Malassezia nana]
MRPTVRLLLSAMTKSATHRRLQAVQRHFQTGISQPVPIPGQTRPERGTFTLGPHVAIPVHEPDAPERVPSEQLWLDTSDPVVLEHLEFLGKKWQLRQDIFLSAPPGPYTRRLCQTFAALIQVPIEYVSLHRDVGEAELLQQRSLEAGGSLRYDDGPVVRAMKHGRILLLDGIERAERGVMPILNNILENREQNLADGTQLVPAERLAARQAEASGHGHATFIPVHPDFRVFCLGLPVPPYRGHPLDPPFRSRFQARWVEGAVYAPPPVQHESHEALSLTQRWQAWLALFRSHTDEMAGLLPSSEMLPHVPETALPLWRDLAALFPPPAPLVAPTKPPEASMPISEATRAMLSTAYPMLFTLDAKKRKRLHEMLARVGLDQGLGADRLFDKGVGLNGYVFVGAERVSPTEAQLTFEQAETQRSMRVSAACGPQTLVPLETLAQDLSDVSLTPRMRALLTVMLQLHCAGRDMCLVPGTLDGSVASQASSSKSTALQLFASLLGYDVETVWLWKDVSGTELLMRRATKPDGATVWEPAPLTSAVLRGALVHLAGVDVLGPTVESLARLTQDRELELWNGTRLTTEPSALDTLRDGRVCRLPPNVRVIASAPKVGDWLTESLASMMAVVGAPPMSHAEERAIVEQRSSIQASAQLDRLFAFAHEYRAQASDANVGLHKGRRLGTRQLIRLARRLARWPDEDLYALLMRNQLCEFLPRTVRDVVHEMLVRHGIVPHGFEGAFQYIPPLQLAPPQIDGATLRFVDTKGRDRLALPRYAWRDKDPEGASLIPQAHGSFFHNAQQTRLLYSFAQDLEVLGEHLLLMGAQGTGKNKTIDQVLELLDRPREYIQMNRDSTVGELLQRAYLEDGQLRYADSPLVRALQLGRVIVVDEVDKCSSSVAAVFKSLAERSELSLPDGRRVVPQGVPADANAIRVHPDFRLVLLANRPGWPFLGNSFTEVIGEGFSSYAVSNPDVESEVELLRRMAPSVDAALIRSLVLSFHDLREAFDQDQISHPYSLRELIHIVRHLDRYPDEELGDVMLNALAFDLHKPEALKLIARTFANHGLRLGGLTLEGVQKRLQAQAEKKDLQVQFRPKGDTSLDRPKRGKDDPNNEPHVGGNTWRGGTGGRDTAGLGGRGGFERLYKGHKIHQIPDELKRNVPEHIQAEAREMARKALAEKLAEDRLDRDEAQFMQSIKANVEPQVQHLANVLNGLTANEHERRWMVRQQDGQLDERRLSEGLVGERTIFKRRSEAPPEIGAPQLKPKRIRIVLDASASMYHMQFDGRLSRELETCLMVMEAMERVDPTRFEFDIVAHSGDEVVIPLVPLGTMPKGDGDRFRVLRNIVAYTQYCMSGDNTVECIQQSVRDVRQREADDYFVIALSDANLGRYAISPEMLGAALKQDDKVKAAVIFIDKGGAEAGRMAQALPGRAFVAQDTREIPRVLSDILTSLMR